MNSALLHEGRLYRLADVEQGRNDEDEIAVAAGAIIELFGRRAEEFSFGADIVVAYPDLAPGSPFLMDPGADVDARVAGLARVGRAVRAIVVLTTFGPQIGPALTARGFRAESLGLIAAPDGAVALRRETRRGATTLYIEAVDEAASDARPNFALGLFDAQDDLAAGVCGVISPRGGETAAWIVANAVRVGEPAGLGTALAALLDDFLRRRGVARIDLGTQTARRFYERVGYRVTRVLLEGLRTRKGPDGRPIPSDLAMMTKRLAS